MKNFFFVLLLGALQSCIQSKSQNETKPAGGGSKIGGPCDGCEAIYLSPLPFQNLSWIDTLPDFNEQGPKLMISGTIYKQDGTTPAKDVVLYVYHTDQTGHYTNKFGEQGIGGRNGYIKGWMKTNEKGRYRFYTLLPASYPNKKVPAHIHPVLKEPYKNDYYIDDYLFDTDPLLTGGERRKQEGRGGNGIVVLHEKEGMLYGVRDICLGRNIPYYPQASGTIQSGLKAGENCPAFDPLHLSGADKGRKVCPMCKYGYGQGVMVWFNHANLDRMQTFAQRLEKEMKLRGEKKLRVFLIYTHPFGDGNETEGERIVQEKIKNWCTGQSLEHVAMLWVPSPEDKESCGLYKINPEATNTVFVYKNRKVAAGWVNIGYTDTAVTQILKTL